MEDTRLDILSVRKPTWKVGDPGSSPSHYFSHLLNLNQLVNYVTLNGFLNDDLHVSGRVLRNYAPKVLIFEVIV